MRLPVKALQIGSNQLPDGSILKVNAKNNSALAKMLHMGLPKCKCCGAKPVYIELHEVDPSSNPDTTTAKYYATMMYSNGESATIDHWHPQSKGGRNSKHNYVAMCQRCNIEKADHVFNSLFDLRVYVIGRRWLQRFGFDMKFKEYLGRTLHPYSWNQVL